MSLAPPSEQHVTAAETRAPSKAQDPDQEVMDIRTLKTIKVRIGLRAVSIVDCIILVGLVAWKWVHTHEFIFRMLQLPPLTWSILCIVWDSIHLALDSMRWHSHSHIKISTSWLCFGVGIEVFLLLLSIPTYIWRSLAFRDDPSCFTLAVILCFFRLILLVLACIDMHNRNKDMEIKAVINRIQQHRAGVTQQPNREATPKPTAEPIPDSGPEPATAPSATATTAIRPTEGPLMGHEMNYEDTHKYVMDFLRAQRR